CQGDEKTQSREGETADRGQAQRHFRVSRNTEHREIEKSVEVVLGLAPFTQWLRILDPSDRKPDLREKTTEVRIGVIHLADDLDDLSVVQTETRAVADWLHVRQPGEQPIVGVAHPGHRPRFLPTGFNAQRHLVTLFPSLQELRNELRRIL